MAALASYLCLSYERAERAVITANRRRAPVSYMHHAEVERAAWRRGVRLFRHLAGRYALETSQGIINARGHYFEDGRRKQWSHYLVLDRGRLLDTDGSVYDDVAAFAAAMTARGVVLAPFSTLLTREEPPTPDTPPA